MGENEIVSAWRRGLQRPDRRPMWQIAREQVNLSGDYDPKGYFRVESSRYLLLPFALLANPLVRMLNLLKSIQTGGTLVGDLFFYYTLKHAPGPFMFTLQTDDDAEQHYLTRIEPTLANSPGYMGIHAGLHKKRDLYQFPGMNVYFQGANMNSLQRKSIKNEVNDEVWDWPSGMLAEAWGRTERFQRSCKIINISQGGDEGSDWDHAYNSGKIYEWGVFCFNCGHHQELSFFSAMLDNPKVRAGIVFDDRRHPSGRRDIDASAATARFRCRKCGHEHANEPRSWERFNANGEYIDTAPLKPVKTSSCHWESAVNGNWDSLVAEFLKAKEILESGSPAALKKFYQKKLARFWAVADSQEKVEVRTSDYNMEDPFAEGYKPVKEVDELYRFITADFQEGKAGEARHFRVVARAWLRGGRSRKLWYGRIDTVERLHALEIALGVTPAAVCVDGGHLLRTVAGWCARYGWTVLIGSPERTFPHPPKKKGEKSPQLPYSRRYRTDPRIGKTGAGRSFAWTFNWSNPSIKPITANLRDGNGPHWGIPDDAPDEYKDGLHSEVLAVEIDRKTAKRKYFWKRIKENNHPWDIENMQTVCAVIAGILPFDIAPEDDEKPDAPDDDAAPRAKVPAKPTAPHDQPEQMTLLGTPA